MGVGEEVVEVVVEVVAVEEPPASVSQRHRSLSPMTRTTKAVLLRVIVGSILEQLVQDSQQYPQQPPTATPSLDWNPFWRWIEDASVPALSLIGFQSQPQLESTGLGHEQHVED